MSIDYVFLWTGAIPAAVILVVFFHFLGASKRPSQGPAWQRFLMMAAAMIAIMTMELGPLAIHLGQRWEHDHESASFQQKLVCGGMLALGGFLALLMQRRQPWVGGKTPERQFYLGWVLYMLAFFFINEIAKQLIRMEP